MTLPKSITDAIDIYQDRIRDGSFILADAAREELETAIAKEIQPVEPTTDAEVNTWHVRFMEWLRRDREGIVHAEGESLVDILQHGYSLIHRARSSLKRLRERVQKVQAEIEANAKNFDTMATAGYGLQVLRWIDEVAEPSSPEKLAKAEAKLKSTTDALKILGRNDTLKIRKDIEEQVVNTKIEETNTSILGKEFNKALNDAAVLTTQQQRLFALRQAVYELSKVVKKLINK